MPKSACCKYTCNLGRTKGVVYHSIISADPAVINQWIKFCDQPPRRLVTPFLNEYYETDWTPANHSLLCSRHFTSDSYFSTGKLKRTAIPTIEGVQHRESWRTACPRQRTVRARCNDVEINKMWEGVMAPMMMSTVDSIEQQPSQRIKSEDPRSWSPSSDVPIQRSPPRFTIKVEDPDGRTTSPSSNELLPDLPLLSSAEPCQNPTSGNVGAGYPLQTIAFDPPPPLSNHIESSPSFDDSIQQSSSRIKTEDSRSWSPSSYVPVQQSSSRIKTEDSRSWSPSSDVPLQQFSPRFTIKVEDTDTVTPSSSSNEPCLELSSSAEHCQNPTSVNLGAGDPLQTIAFDPPHPLSSHIESPQSFDDSVRQASPRFRINVGNPNPIMPSPSPCQNPWSVKVGAINRLPTPVIAFGPPLPESYHAQVYEAPLYPRFALPWRTELDHTYTRPAHLKPGDDLHQDSVQDPSQNSEAEMPPVEEPLPESPVPSPASASDNENEEAKNDESDFDPGNISSSSDSEMSVSDKSSDSVPPSEQKRYLVFEKNLEQLLKRCLQVNCSKPVIELNHFTVGTMVRYKLTCLDGHVSAWNSQPLIGRKPVGNITP